VLPSAQLGSVYREKSAGRRRGPTRRSSKLLKPNN
jgi:hypothetical protein